MRVRKDIGMGRMWWDMGSGENEIGMERERKRMRWLEGHGMERGVLGKAEWSMAATVVWS